MTNAIPSTHQQDRLAQQKLANARQQASAADNGTRTSFATLLGLSCDEDINPDAQAKTSPGNRGVAVGAPSDGEGLPTSSPRSARHSRGRSKDEVDDAESNALNPAAQANATLLALLAQAQQGSANATAPDQDAPTGRADAAPADAVTATTAGAASSDPGSEPVLEASAETRTPPGHAVRNLARQLGAAMRAAANDQPPEPSTRHADSVGASTATTDLPPGLTMLAAKSTALAPRDDADKPSSGPQLVSPMAGDDRGVAVNDTDEAAASVEAAPAQGVRTSSSQETGGGNQGGMGGDALGGPAAPTDHSPAPETLAAADQWQTQWAEAMEQMAQQVTYWMGQGGVRQATLRVGQGWQQAMDVRLSLKNGKADITFLTDHAASRQAIAEGGIDVLRGMLAQSGVDIGQVAVGTASGDGAGAGGERDGRHGSGGVTPGHKAPHPGEGLPHVMTPIRGTSPNVLDLYV